LTHLQTPTHWRRFGKQNLACFYAVHNLPLRHMVVPNKFGCANCTNHIREWLRSYKHETRSAHKPYKFCGKCRYVTLRRSRWGTGFRRRNSADLN